METNMLRNLGDEELAIRLDELVVEEKRLGAEIVAHLCEVERRGLHLVYGYSSLYSYCVERLGLSEDVAYARMQAARAAGRCPEVLEHLESGELSVSAVKTIAPHLEAFGADLVQAAVGKSTREVKRLVAELVAQPVAKVVKLQPVAGGKMKLEMVMDAELAKLIEETIAMDRHVDPSGDVGALIERAVTCYAESRRKKRLAETADPWKTRQTRTEKPKPRTIPAQVRRQVAERDDGQCTYVGKDGHRCTEKGFLEFDHRTPVASGGSGASASNVRLLCRAHNQQAAETSFGKTFMQSRREQSQLRRDLIVTLHRMGFAKPTSRQAVDHALAQAPAANLEMLLRASLRATRHLE